MFRWLRWRWAKIRLASPPLIQVAGRVRICRERPELQVEDLPWNLNGYESMACVWDEYAALFRPGYDRFVAAARNYYGQPIRSVLDLACGTGLHTRSLAWSVDRVIGLDASESMLREARARTKVGNVSYIQNDFRDFSLAETFDAAICGGDSLNYLETPAELAAVFGCVRRHLRGGGLFVFDVLGADAFRALAMRNVAARVGNQCFKVYYFYDPDRRVSESRVVMDAGIERHRRIPIDEADVRREASAAGLELADQFSTNGWLFSFKRDFYLMRKPG